MQIQDDTEFGLLIATGGVLPSSLNRTVHHMKASKAESRAKSTVLLSWQLWRGFVSFPRPYTVF